MKKENQKGESQHKREINFQDTKKRQNTDKQMKKKKNQQQKGNRQNYF